MIDFNFFEHKLFVFFDLTFSILAISVSNNVLTSSSTKSETDSSLRSLLYAKKHLQKCFSFVAHVATALIYLPTEAVGVVMDVVVKIDQQKTASVSSFFQRLSTAR